MSLLTRPAPLRKLAILCAALAALGGALAGMGSDAATDSTLERIKKAGIARVAIARQPPFIDYEPNGEPTGASLDLTREVLRRLGVPKIETQTIEWGAMLSGLHARQFDIISTGLSIQPQRCRLILFSEPDTCTARAFAVRKGNPKRLDGMEALRDSADAKLGVCGGCFDETRAIEIGVPRDRIVQVADVLESLKMLQAGRVDAVAWSDIALGMALRRLGDADIELVRVKGFGPNCSGAGFRKDDRALREAYDAVLKDMKASGEFAKILRPYGFDPGYAIANTRGSFCGGPN